MPVQTAWILGVFFLAALPVRAALEDAFYSPRSAAMGGAMTANGDDSSAVFYNPALLGQIRHPGVDADYLRLKSAPSGTVSQNITDGLAAVPAPQSLHGTFGLAGLYNQDASQSSASRQIKAGYASRELIDTGSGLLDFGGTIDYIDESFSGGGRPAAHAAADLGTLYRFDERYSFGASLLNLGSPRFRAPSGLLDQAPTTFRAGFAESLSGYALALDAVRSGAAGNVSPMTYAALGMERWIPTADYGSFAARAGLNLGSRNKMWSMGVGWKALGGEADYAMIIPLNGPAAVSHALSLSFRFGVSDPEAAFERILKEEMGYRKELSRALEAGEIREWQLTEQLKDLRAQLDTLKSELTDKSLSEKDAQAKLQGIEGRYREAMAKFSKIKIERERAAALSDQERFQQDWAGYQKLKAAGTPDSVLITEVKRILRNYQGKKADLAPANRELLRLLGGG